MDAADAVGGHGTHVSGSVAGNAGGIGCPPGLGRFDGMAPAARLLFADLQCNTPLGCGCGDRGFCPCAGERGGKCPSDGHLYPPDDLGHGYASSKRAPPTGGLTGEEGIQCDTGPPGAPSGT